MNNRWRKTSTFKNINNNIVIDSKLNNFEID